MINLIKDFYIEADSLQYILKKKQIRQKKDTKEEYEDYETFGYYSSIKSAVTLVLKQINLDEIASGEIKTLNECVENMEKCKNELIEICKGLK